MNIIQVDQLVKTFKVPFSARTVKALDGLSFSVEKGTVVGFLGANGAGKTTTLKIILGFIFADAGTVHLFGQNHSQIELKRRLGFLTERPYFYDHLTGREFLKFCASLFRDKNLEKNISPLLEEVGLAHAADRPMRQYSKGMLQRIGIAQALVGNPELLILDEPMTGLDPDGRAEILQIIRSCHQRGVTVLFSTHLIPDVEYLCDRVIIINKGKLVTEDSVQSLLKQSSQGYRVLFREDGESPQNEIKIDSIENLQKSIDDLRSQKFQIERVEPLQPSLEQVFLKLKAQKDANP